MVYTHKSQAWEQNISAQNSVCKQKDTLVSNVHVHVHEYKRPPRDHSDAIIP